MGIQNRKCTMRAWFIPSAALVILLGGCASDKLIGRPDLTIVSEGVFPPPTRQDLILQQRSYVIGPFDKVSVDVYGVPDLSRTIQVDAAGQIAMPLIGTIKAAGKTPEELSSLIREQLVGRYVRDPQVTVNTDTINQSITVMGAVETPGQYPVTGRMTLLRAIASAKGTTQYVKENYIVVFRQVDNKSMAALYDIRAIRQGLYADPEVYANDLVLVGESGAARSFATFIQSGAVLVTPLIAIIQRL